MNEGMLWFDNNPKIDLAAKISRAVEYYRKKYRQEPNLCLINPSMLEADQEMPTITVRPYRPVLPGHFWIGVDTKA